MIYFVLIVKTLRMGHIGNRQPNRPVTDLPGGGVHAAPGVVTGSSQPPQVGPSKAAEYQATMGNKGSGGTPESGREREVEARETGESERAPEEPGGGLAREAGVPRELSMDLEMGYGPGLKGFS